MSYTIIEKTGSGLAWLGHRNGFIGASEAGVVVGMSPYETEYELWKRKTSGIITEQDLDLFYFAHELEAPIARRTLQKWPDEFGKIVDSPGLIQWDEHPHLGATPDFLIEHQGRVVTDQIKTVGPHARASWGDALTERDVPDHYRIQVIQESAILGEPYGFITPLFGLTDLAKPIRIETDEDFLAWYIERSAAWWQRHMIGGVAPELTIGDDLVEFWPGNQGEKKIGTYDVLKDVREGKRYRDITRKDAEAEDEARKFRISAFLGDATELIDPEKGENGELVLTWRPKKSPAVFDLAALRADHPDLVEAYTRPGKPQRSMLFKATHESKLELIDHKATQQ